MDGQLGMRPDEVADSLEILDGTLDHDSLYAVFGSFEGDWQVLRFDNIVNQSSLLGDPSHEVSISVPWGSTLKEEEYVTYVETIRNEIAKGWVYQVNACRLLLADSDEELRFIFNEIQRRHAAPAAGYLRTDRWEIASASPETFFKVERRSDGRFITTSPIKGTSRDGRFKEKDSAENVMIVDLMRNDISPLCALGTVNVPRLLGVEEHPGLFHLVSDVEGQLREDVTGKEILERLSPAGSISGAPKSSALEVISRFESYRGAYCGTLGWIRGDEAHFSVLIRTFFRDRLRNPGQIAFGTGAGITWGSDAQDEWNETLLKAERLIALTRVKGQSGSNEMPAYKEGIPS